MSTLNQTPYCIHWLQQHFCVMHKQYCFPLLHFQGPGWIQDLFSQHPSCVSRQKKTIVLEKVLAEGFFLHTHWLTSHEVCASPCLFHRDLVAASKTYAVHFRNRYTFSTPVLQKFCTITVISPVVPPEDYENEWDENKYRMVKRIEEYI